MKMKKITEFFFLGIYIMVLSSVVCYAENTNSFSLDNTNPDLYEGYWQRFDNCFELFLPSDWNYTIPGNTDAVSKCLFLFESKENPALRLSIEKMDAADTFE